MPLTPNREQEGWAEPRGIGSLVYQGPARSHSPGNPFRLWQILAVWDAFCKTCCTTDKGKIKQSSKEIAPLTSAELCKVTVRVRAVCSAARCGRAVSIHTQRGWMPELRPGEWVREWVSEWGSWWERQAARHTLAAVSLATRLPISAVSRSSHQLLARSSFQSAHTLKPKHTLNPCGLWTARVLYTLSPLTFFSFSISFVRE